MVDPDHRTLSLRQQCRLLSFSRSWWYSAQIPKPSEEEKKLMDEIDRVYTDCPWYGSRRVRAVLRRKNQWTVNRKRIQRLMRKMGLAGVQPGRNTSRPHPKHRVYPYLLRNVKTTGPNQVWCADITYIPIGSGHMYLVAIMDWHTRYVLAWELSNTLDSSFCVEALEAALQHGTPEIFNTDQGCQFTSEAFTGRLKAEGIRISMDGRGRALDNVFVERLWRSVKYEDIYIRSYDTAPELYRGLIRYFHYYNEERPHQGLGDRTPGEVHRGEPEWNSEGGRSPAVSAAPTNLTSILAADRPPAAGGPGGPGNTGSMTP